MTVQIETEESELINGKGDPMATTKKATTKKAAPKKEPAQVEEVEEKFDSLVERLQTNLTEATSALKESGAIMDEKRREILLAVIENAQENTDATFDALRQVLESKSLSESLRIQRDAIRAGIERGVAQVRDVASLAAQGGRESITPVQGYISSLRGAK